MIEIKPPMNGRIVEVLVNEGDQVYEQQHVVTLESMKMEMPIVAPQDGTVKKINVKADQAVAKEDILIILE